MPFCDSICEYCDFFRIKTNEKIINQWLLALKNEINIKPKQNYETIYIGGGTPSALSSAQLNILLKLLNVYSKDVIEYTFEANPESLSLDKIKVLKQYGVNRISLGVQILDDKLLKLLNRQHSVSEVIEVILSLKANGFDNISIDMMYGLPYQSLEMWKNHLQEVTKWPIKHISIYSLTIEENSAFGRKHYQKVDNELEGLMYEEGIKILQAKGFKQYEVANFAKANYESRHNMGYWQAHDYMNLSCGAVGTIGNRRINNTTNINDYISGKFIDSEEMLSELDKIFEYIMLGLRLVHGISLTDFKNRFDFDLVERYKNIVDKYVKLDYLKISDDYLSATPKGIELLHEILVDFME